MRRREPTGVRPKTCYVMNGRSYETAEALGKALGIRGAAALLWIKKGVSKDGDIIRTKKLLQ